VVEAMKAGDVAARWKCSKGHVYALIRGGALHAFKVGSKSLRVSLAEVERYEREGGGLAKTSPVPSAPAQA